MAARGHAAAGGEDANRGYVHRRYVEEIGDDEESDGAPARFFGADPTLRTTPLSPSDDRRIRLAPTAGEGARRLADSWNQHSLTD